MLNIKVFNVNMIRENCYVVYDETGEGVVVDCGVFYPDERENVQTFLYDNHVKIKHLICTHGHFDHILGDQFIYGICGTKPEISAADAFLYDNCVLQLRMVTDDFHDDIVMPPLGDFLTEKSRISFGNHVFTVISTPGHTPGGVSFYCADENVLFSGDSLFRRSVGRTDFPYGDEDLLLRKLKENVMTLPLETNVYPGHGYPTTIGEEKRENPFVTTLA